MTRTRFNTGIVTGKDRGAATLNTTGAVLVVQDATAQVGTSGRAFRIPQHATVHSIQYRELVAETSAGTVTTIRVGTSDDATFFGSIVATVASQKVQHVVVSAGGFDKWLDQSTDVDVFIDVTAAGSAGTQLTGILSMTYFHSSNA